MSEVSAHLTTDEEGGPLGLPSPRDSARSMLSLGARLVTIVCTPGQPATLRYVWDVSGSLQESVFAAPSAGPPSIADLTLAADWIEREIHDYYAVPFLGRADLTPLMLRPGDEPGVFADSAPALPVTKGAGASGLNRQESAR